MKLIKYNFFILLFFWSGGLIAQNLVDKNFTTYTKASLPQLKELLSIPNDAHHPEWRIFARSTSDSKGAINMFLTAMDMIGVEGFSPNFNIKVIMDFEEELGSPNLPQALVDYKKDLSADMLVIFDGPRHSTNRPTLTFGARG